jgi:surfactin synthase thioesterase subunit
MVGWRYYTLGEHRVEGFDGGHFFPHERFEEVAARLTDLAQRRPAQPRAAQRRADR